MSDTVELAWDARCATGESPVRDAAGRRVLFCDIPNGRQAIWQLPEPVGRFGALGGLFRMRAPAAGAPVGIFADG